MTIDPDMAERKREEMQRKGWLPPDPDPRTPHDREGLRKGLRNGVILALCIYALLAAFWFFRG